MRQKVGDTWFSQPGIVYGVFPIRGHGVVTRDTSLYQIDLMNGSKNRATEHEYWAKKKEQLVLDEEKIPKQN